MEDTLFKLPKNTIRQISIYRSVIHSILAAAGSVYQGRTETPDDDTGRKIPNTEGVLVQVRIVLTAQ